MIRIGIVPLLSLLLSLCASEPAMTWTYPRLIAHRGSTVLAPENTLPAFIEAARRGYRCIECDVALTSDSVPVLLHDDTLKRTAGHPARLADLTAAAVAGLDAGSWFAPRFAGTRIPTFEQAIACWLEHRQQAMIELKTGRPESGQDPERLGRIAAETVLRCWRGEPPVFISFSAAALAAAAKTAPQIPRALLLGSPLPEDWRKRVALAQPMALDVEQSLATPARIAETHAAGLALMAWTVNDLVRVQALLELGVDAVTTDAIDRITP